MIKAHTNLFLHKWLMQKWLFKNRPTHPCRAHSLWAAFVENALMMHQSHQGYWSHENLWRSFNKLSGEVNSEKMTSVGTKLWSLHVISPFIKVQTQTQIQSEWGSPNWTENGFWSKHDNSLLHSRACHIRPFNKKTRCGNLLVASAIRVSVHLEVMKSNAYEIPNIVVGFIPGFTRWKYE